MWTQSQMDAHKQTASLLDNIMEIAFQYILTEKRRVTEYEVLEFILGEFRKNHIHFGSIYPLPIVSFGRNTEIIHYFPNRRSSIRLRPRMAVLIDIWGRLTSEHAPFADITWFGYYGNSIPKKIKKVFSTVIAARDASISFVRREVKGGRLPTGQKVDSISGEIMDEIDLGEYSTHGLGHVLGISSPHGSQLLSGHNRKPLQPGFAYTIEPGMYFENRFGVRSEMDFLITPDLGFEITTRLQRKIVHLS